MQISCSSVAAAVLSALCVVWADAAQRPVGGDWLTYEDPQQRFSFQYPSNLTVKSLEPEWFRTAAGLVAGVDLVSGPESTVVLRVLASEPVGNPMAVSYDRPFLRKVCKSYQEMRIGPLEAVNCVTCGSAACNWTTYVLGRRQFQIFTMLPGETDLTGPRDGAFPLLSIIRSLKGS